MQAHSTVSVCINVPPGQEDCASWINQQPPAIAADALRLCGPAYVALQREIGREEHERLCAQYHHNLEQLRNEMEELKREHALEQQHIVQVHREKRQELEARFNEERDAFLTEKRAAIENTQVASDQNWQQHLELLQSKHEREKRTLQAEAQDANDRLASKHASEVEVRETLRAQYEERLQAARASHEILEQRYRLELETKDKQLSDAWQWHREQSEQFQQRLQALQHEKESRELKHADELRQIVEQQTLALSRFNGTSSRIGQAGEALVSDVFGACTAWPELSPLRASKWQRWLTALLGAKTRRHPRRMTSSPILCHSCGCCPVRKSQTRTSARSPAVASGWPLHPRRPSARIAD